MQKLVKEFREFFMGGNVIDLAVAVIVGGLFAKIVQAMVDNILMPIIGILFGKPSFDQALILTINDSQIRFGAFLTVAVSVILTALAVFLFIVKPYNIYRARQKAAEAAAPAGPTEVELLTQIRDALARR